MEHSSSSLPWDPSGEWSSLGDFSSVPGLLALCFSSELWGLFSPSAGTARTLQLFSSFAKSSYSCEYGSAKDPVLNRNPDIPLELGFVTVSSGSLLKFQ